MENAGHIKMIKPVGYFDFLLLLSKSKFIMTDSGGIQEEAITLNIPCATLRYNTERPETVEAGGNVLVGAEKGKIVDTVREILDNPGVYSKMSEAENPYGKGDSSKRILNAILNLFEENKLKITVPEDIMKIRNRQIVEISENITVNEFEKENIGSQIRMVFENGDVMFPYSDLNLMDKMILLDSLKIT
jgi:UDP-N-acetylglucosamine 2-epimerase (non-hydrolysing)